MQFGNVRLTRERNSYRTKTAVEPPQEDNFVDLSVDGKIILKHAYTVCENVNICN
jgi:hypothetical protein